jgi:hypothetical protein
MGYHEVLDWLDGPLEDGAWGSPHILILTWPLSRLCNRTWPSALEGVPEKLAQRKEAHNEDVMSVLRRRGCLGSLRRDEEWLCPNAYLQVPG